MDKERGLMDNLAQNPPGGLLASQIAEAAYFFRRPAGRTAGLHPVLGGRERCRPDYRLGRDDYPYWVIEYVVSGAGEARAAGKRFPLGPGTVFCYPPRTGMALETDPQRPLDKFFVALGGAGVRPALARAGLVPGRPVRLEVHAPLQSAWEELIREGRRTGPVSDRLVSGLLGVLLLRLEDLVRHPEHGPDRARLNFLRCKSVIDGNVAQIGSLAAAARACGLEASSICRLFRRFQGTSPHRYILRARMNLAAELILSGGCLVKEAAARVGFEDPYHFSRRFKAVHGVPPSALAWKGGRPPQA
jgi:AraC family transcriptional regulator